MSMDLDDQIQLGHLLLEVRKCRSCGEEKNLIESFYRTRKNDKLPSSYSYECKECTVKRIEQNRKIMVKFDEYSNMITKQNNRCAVCETLQRGRKYNSFKVDRDPKTNAPRGLVCKRCHSLLKLVDGDLTTLNNMIKYLSKHTGSYEPN